MVHRNPFTSPFACKRESPLCTCLTTNPCHSGIVSHAVHATQAFQQQHGARQVVDVLDVGCSVGVSARWLAQEFPDASIVGLDLSPYFLAVAELRER